MPRKAAATQVVEEDTEKDFTIYAEKEPTGTMVAFADWLIDVCELDFPNGKAEENFRFGVQLGGTLRMDFQASEYWRADERNPRSPAGKKTRAAANGGATTTRRGKAQADEEEIEEEEGEEQEQETAKPTRRGRAAAKPAATGRGRKPAAAKPAATGRGRGRKPAADAAAPY
jgi:hypothetical protein